MKGRLSAAPAEGKRIREIPDVETLLAGLRGRIAQETRRAFLSTFAMGLVVHLYMLVNKLPNHDDVLALFQHNDASASGRWFLWVPSALSTGISLPWTTGLIAICYLSLAAACIVALFRLRKTSSILLVSAVLVTFPTIFYTFCYMFTADAYFIAMLLSCLAVLLTDRTRAGFLAGGVCIGLSLGCYQAYVFFSVGLMAVRLMVMALCDGADGKTIFLRALRFALALAVGAVVYKIGLTLTLSIRQISLKTYMGLDGIASLSLTAIISRIPLAYQTFLSFFTGDSQIVTGRFAVWMFRFVALVSVALYAAAAIRLLRSRTHGRFWRAALATLLLLLLPCAVTGVVLVSTAGMHPLMFAPVSLLLLLPVILLEALPQPEGADGYAPLLRLAKNTAGYALTLLLTALSFLWALDANQTYFALELKFDNMMSLATRMVDRVERLPEYVPDETPVWYTGTLSDAHYGAVKSAMFARASATDMTGREWNYTTFMNNLYFSEFINNYIGVTFRVPEDADAEAVLETDAYKAMPYFPAEGSVRYIDGIIIINGGPNPQSPP